MEEVNVTHDDETPEEEWDDSEDTNDEVPPEEESESVTLQVDPDDDEGEEDQEEGDDEVDERGVSWKNVAMEMQRKLAEKEQEGRLAAERERVMKEVMENLPRYHEDESVEEDKPTTPAKDPDQLWREGKHAEAVALMVDRALEAREGRTRTQTLQEQAAETKQKLLTEHPDLGNKDSEFFKVVQDCAKELQSEWAGMGLNVDLKELNKRGLTVLLEKQAVDRALLKHPKFRKTQGEEEVVKAKERKSTPGAGKVTSGSGKPSSGRKGKESTKSGAKTKLSDEQAALRRQYGLSDDPGKVERHANRVAEYEKATGRKI